jgi:CRP/FNR family transcriptional regulator/CRP/FNR family cyclic AMP-dependent transcriptional regulator
LSPVELEKLEAITARRTFRSGSAVFFQDDPSDSFYVLLKGSAKVFQTSEDGQDRILNTLRPGESVGELAMIEGLPRQLSVQALEDTEMLVVERRDFMEYARQHPDVLWKLLQALSERVRQLMDSVLDMSFRDVPYRVLHVFQQLTQRHGVAEGDGWRVRLGLSTRELASMVGAGEESVARLLDRFQSEGLLRREGQDWIVPERRALERALEYAGQ